MLFHKFLILRILISLMKILTVVFIRKGGTERAAQNFALGYSKNGCDSRVLVTNFDGPRKDYLEYHEIPVYFLGNELDHQVVHDWYPDVVHIHSHGISLESFDELFSLCSHAKFVETNVFSRPSPWAEHILFSFQLSQWCNWLFSCRSKNKYRSVIIPNPVDTDAFVVHHRSVG